LLAEDEKILPKILIIVSLAEHLINTDIKETAKLDPDKIIEYIQTACQQRQEKGRLISRVRLEGQEEKVEYPLDTEDVVICLEFARNPVAGEYIHHYLAEFAGKYGYEPEEVIFFFIETITPDKKMLADQIFHQATLEQIADTVHRAECGEKLFTIWFKLYCQDDRNITPDEIWENERNKYFLIK